MSTFYETQESTLSEIKDKDVVFDITGKKIGTVKFIQMPSELFDPPLNEFPYHLVKADLPVDLVYRLLSTGFVFVEAGWFTQDRLIQPEQISVVAPGKVYLNAHVSHLVSA